MPRPRKGINREIKEQIRKLVPVNITPTAARELDLYLSEALPAAIRKRDEILPRVQKWRRILAGERTPLGRRRRGQSNIVVPLLIWARVAVRARLSESLLENRPLVMIEPAPGRTADGRSNQTLANSLARFFGTEIRSQEGLDGRRAIEKITAEMVDLGGAALKVVPTPDRVRKIGPNFAAGTTEPTKSILRGRVKWEHISLLDLVYLDGYGTDTQAMPFIGHQFCQAWNEILAFGEIGHYDKATVKEVEASFAMDEAKKPAAMREHDLIELYMDYDVDGDGIQEAIMITWHEKARKRLATVWNPFPDGRRPILAGQFDLPGDMSKLMGQGVSEKLENVQDEVDAIHNLIIEGGKRAAASIIVLKESSRAEEEFGGDQNVMPGDTIVTGNAQEDVAVHPLGDPQAGRAGLELEEHSRLYVTRILGLDEARVGNVEAGKRVAASVGMATMREGRMIIKSALTSIANMLQEAAYLTFDLYKQYVPRKALYAALPRADADALLTNVFSIDEASMRNAFLVRVNATDAAIAQQQKQQEMAMLTQVLFPFFDRYERLIMALENPQLPPGAKKPLLHLVERMERAQESLLNSFETVPSPDDLMVKVGELKRLLEESQNATDPTQASTNPGEDAMEEDNLVGDLGAGVA